MSGIAAYDAVPGNVLQSVKDWIFGTYVDTYPLSAARILTAPSTLQAFTEIYATAPDPILASRGREADQDLGSLLKRGSPVLVFAPSTLGDWDGLVGDLAGVVSWRLQLTVHCRVWINSGTGIVDNARTERQLQNAGFNLGRILTKAGSGCFPIYDYTETPPQGTKLGMGSITEVTAPVARSDTFRSDLTFLVSALAGADGLQT